MKRILLYAALLVIASCKKETAQTSEDDVIIALKSSVLESARNPQIGINVSITTKSKDIFISKKVVPSATLEGVDGAMGCVIKIEGHSVEQSMSKIWCGFKDFTIVNGADDKGTCFRIPAGTTALLHTAAIINKAPITGRYTAILKSARVYENQSLTSGKIQKELTPEANFTSIGVDL